MSKMNSATVTHISSARDRTRRVSRAIDASRRLRSSDDLRSRESREGRAWVNGSELGGPRMAFAHLAESYD